MATRQQIIDEVWARIKSHEGEKFETRTGKTFTYHIDGEIFHPSRTEYNISKRNFEIALELVPLDGPGIINNLVRGPAYVWAVLHDHRIRGQDW